ncbi:60s acidic ribosomal protein-domain-containing protein [Phascolomyces articulosus]|uniref:60s acidic ribosomal protein-domain-containing protein n=1 Tax=Phascolomyces articulosus TaxID=60185 RepID=A0AAD5K9N0_9FUNG|nr:60s acidic ribosomal protein-domain-containing protein [Phascolomyces articulosus]
MKYLAAYLLLVAGGKAAPTAADVKSVLGSVGVEVEADRLESLIKALEGKTVDEVLAEGKEKLASVPTGGAVAAGGAAAGGAAAEEAAEEAKEEEKEESDEDMGFGLFD